MQAPMQASKPASESLSTTEMSLRGGHYLGYTILAYHEATEWVFALENKERIQK